MKLNMKIEQSDNGWILRFVGHDCLNKVIVRETWEDVLRELDDHFGWWVGDKWVKKP